MAFGVVEVEDVGAPFAFDGGGGDAQGVELALDGSQIGHLPTERNALALNIADGGAAAVGHAQITLGAQVKLDKPVGGVGDGQGKLVAIKGHRRRPLRTVEDRVGARNGEEGSSRRRVTHCSAPSCSQAIIWRSA